MIVMLLVFIALGQQYYDYLYTLRDYILIKIIIFLWTYTLFFHLINGIRYLVWSTTYGMSTQYIYISGYLVIFFSFLLTILVWVVI